MTQWIMALGGSSHDFSCTVMRDSDILVAIEEERLSRRKHGICNFYENPVQYSMRYCLDYSGITLDDIDVIVSSDLLPARVRFELRGRRLRLFPHHLCHAVSAYMLAPAGASAAILVYDGMGSVVEHSSAHGDTFARNTRETFSFYYATSSGEITCLGRTTGQGLCEFDEFPISLNNSIGMLYEFITALIGFHHMDAGKTMGLAAHGAPRYLPVLKRFTRLSTNPNDCFTCELDDPAFRSEIQAILDAGGNSFAVKADLAASVQELVNQTLLTCVAAFRGRSYDYLCLAGGCALNTVATSHLIDHWPHYVPIIVPPHVSDAGLGLGALYLWQAQQVRAQPALTFRGGPLRPALARPGRPYAMEECIDAARRFYPRLVPDASVSTAADLARCIAAGEIIAVANGPAEIGPRALGGRSIFADPRSARTRETLNRRIKGREPFRPLAPMVLSSAYETYFCDRRHADPYMLKVSRATERCKREAPAVVHVDGSARTQVIGDEDDPFLVELLTEFEKLTGLPMLLNTSFNRRGEPIVESPVDAIDAFLGMKLDGLFLHGVFYRQVPQ